MVIFYKFLSCYEKWKKNWRDATISMVTESDFVRINKDNILQQRNNNKTMLSKT